MPEEFSLSPLIGATTRWLTHTFPSGPGALTVSLAEAQARQAVTVAAWLRYPTELDVELVAVTGPGGSARLDWVTGADIDQSGEGHDHPWRSWVDEVVASWAASLLSTPPLAAAAMEALADTMHFDGAPVDFRRLTQPDDRDWRAAPLLRHPDFLAPIAELHQEQLLHRLGGASPGRRRCTVG